MTTVAWKQGTIAADRKLDGWMHTGKLFRLKDGSVLAGAGIFDEIVEVAAWLRAGAKPADKPEVKDGDPTETSDYLLACPDGKAYWLTVPYLRRVEILDPFIAIGSGKDLAMGAMAAGATPRRAVEIACRFDKDTGNGVDVIKVKR